MGIAFANYGVDTKLDDTYDSCSRELDPSYPDVGFPYDSEQRCDNSQQGYSTAEADFSGASGYPDRLGQASRTKRYLMLIGTMLALLIALAFSSYLRNYFQSYESTRGARIVARTTPINARIDGTITGLYVEPFQRVKGGQLLLQLDPRDREIAVEQARAQPPRPGRTSMSADSSLLWLAPRSVKRKHVIWRNGKNNSAI